MEKRVYFNSDNPAYNKIFNAAESKLLNNVKVFDGRRVLIEGSTYSNLWLETQPMGGEMYAKRDLEIAYNNHMIFMENIRKDGRFPGMISRGHGGLKCDYEWLQGCFFAVSAYKIYYLCDLKSDYLKLLYECLKAFDEYLWKYRDSDGDGCLETWCVWDTGEDNSSRLKGFPEKFGGEIAPTEFKPFESMDFMGFSYANRDILSKVSRLLGNGESKVWREKANAVKRKIRNYLWDDSKKACFDRDGYNKRIPVLIHNNLRVMYFNAFTQSMANDFVKYHLLNEKEFWTPMPLPSIAVNEEIFQNEPFNNWSGQPQGLTYQRAIRALENYGFFGVVAALGEKLLNAIGDECIFTQQFDPFTAKPSLPKKDGLDGYGPTMLAALEYISRMYGIHIDENTVWWSAIENETEFEYSQQHKGHCYKIIADKSVFRCYDCEKFLFEFAKGNRVITDIDGKIIKVIDIR